jgi:hypothetical protein
MPTSPRISSSSSGDGGAKKIAGSPTAEGAYAIFKNYLQNIDKLTPTANKIKIHLQQNRAIIGKPRPCLTHILVEKVNSFSLVHDHGYYIKANQSTVKASIPAKDRRNYCNLRSDEPMPITINFPKNQLQVGNIYRIKFFWDLTGTFYDNKNAYAAHGPAVVIDKLSPKEAILDNTAKTVKILNRNTDIKPAGKNPKHVPLPVEIIENYAAEDWYDIMVAPFSTMEAEKRYLPAALIKPPVLD